MNDIYSIVKGTIFWHRLQFIAIQISPPTVWWPTWTGHLRFLIYSLPPTVKMKREVSRIMWELFSSGPPNWNQDLNSIVSARVQSQLLNFSPSQQILWLEVVLTDSSCCGMFEPKQCPYKDQESPPTVTDTRFPPLTSPGRKSQTKSYHFPQTEWLENGM